MEQVQQTDEVQTASPANGEGTNEVSADNSPKLDNLKKQYFASDKIATDGQTAINSTLEIAAAHDLEVVYNFDVNKEFPAGYGISIVPIAKRAGGETITLGVAIAAIPDVETVKKHENGNQFIVDAVIGNMVAKLANAVRPRGEANETAASIPYSVDDFITSNRPEGVLVAFRTYAGAYVKVLKKKGLKFITDNILRQVLQSRAFAEQQFPSVPQEKWVQILDSMIARAASENIAAGLLSEWKQTRDSATLQDRDVDLSDLDFSDI